MGRRPQRLGEAIREEVARMATFELKDPRLGLVTVTRVELSADLVHARVYVGVLGSEEERRRSLEALHGAAGFVRRELGHRLRIRQVPEIEFRYDKGLDATDRVARLLEQDRLAAAGAGDGPDGTAEGGAASREATDNEDDEGQDG